jgi:cell pole-organizing protein PopZ
MANPSTANEPSMEEILASIRQIISEDGDGSPAARPEGRGKDPAEQDGPPDVDLAAAAPASPSPRAERAPQQGGSMKPQTSDNPARAQQPAQSAPAAAAPAPEARRSAEAPAPAPQPQAAAKPTSSPAPQRQNGSPEQRSLLSDRSNAAVSGAFGTLTHTILAQHARTLDDLVAEMLRPMLKEWLDDNLPPLVERLVKEEIERVSRGRR